MKYHRMYSAIKKFRLYCLNPNFRPTKTRDVPKITTLPSHKRTTIPVSSEYESWAPSSGAEKSGSGEDVMPQLEDHRNHKPTQRMLTMGTLSSTRKTHAGKYLSKGGHIK